MCHLVSVKCVCVFSGFHDVLPNVIKMVCLFSECF